MKFYVIQDRQWDTYAAPTLKEAIELAAPNSLSEIKGAWTVDATDAGAARLMKGAPVDRTELNEALIAFFVAP